jgi:hypothetical protein
MGFYEIYLYTPQASLPVTKKVIGMRLQHSRKPMKPKGRFRTVATVMTDTLVTTPLAKLIGLYGLDHIPGPTKAVSERQEEFEEKHERAKGIANLISWGGIGFGLAYLGVILSRSLSFLGKTMGDIIGFTSAFVHPSMISLAIKKITKRKDKDVSASRYYEALSIAELPAQPAFFLTLNWIVCSENSSMLSTERAVSATLLACMADYITWSIGFSAYWLKIVRKEKESLLKNLRGFGKGFVSAITPWKHKTPENGVEEAGALVGTGFFVWAIPWYTIRGVTSSLVAMNGVHPEEFNDVWIPFTNMLIGISVFLNGVKMTIIEGIIKRRNREL